MTRSRRLALCAGLGAVALAPAAEAQKPAKPPKGGVTAITLDVKPAIVVFGGATTLSGRLSGGNVGGVTVRLEEDTTRPYGDAYKPTGQSATTTTTGTYAFTVRPQQNTQYRVVPQGGQRQPSAGKLVLVRMRVGLRLSDRTPNAGSRVRFSGSVLPAHDGRTALIQRRSATGRFVTVARATLRDAGDERSVYSRRLRVRRDGVYRVKVTGDLDHINGFSRRRLIDVG